MNQQPSLTNGHQFSDTDLLSSLLPRLTQGMHDKGASFKSVNASLDHIETLLSDIPTTQTTWL